MPRGIPNAPDGVGYVFVLIIVFAIIMLVLAWFFAGWHFISPPFIFIWDFLQSIWYWLPHAIVGILITTLLVLNFVYVNDLLDGCLIAIIVPLGLAVVGFVAITLIGFIWTITVNIENESKEVHTPAEAIAP